MDYNSFVTLICYLLTGLSGLLAYLWRRSESVLEARARKNSEDIDVLKRELSDFKLHVAETYVTNSELTKAIDSLNKTMEAVFAKLEQIRDKLDTKADK